MKIGTSTVTAIYLGTTSIVSAYLGSTQVFGGASAFSPLDLFSTGAQGVWYDPSDLTTMFVDRAGTTPVTAPGQLVGLRLDKSKVLVLGAELVTNGTFDSGTTGWEGVGGTISAVSGRLRVSYSTSSPYGRQGVTCVVGNTYLLTGQYFGGAETTRLYIGDSNTGANAQGLIDFSGDGTATVRFRATATTMWIIASGRSLATGEFVEFDNISVRELAGNHAVAPTDAARPTYGVEPKGGRRNLLTWSEDFGNAVWAKTNSTITADAATAPDGTTTADKLVGIAATTYTRARQAFTFTSGALYDFSVYAKEAELPYLFIQIPSTLFPANQSAYFDLSSGTVGAVTGGTASITSVGNGWYRCSIATQACTTTGSSTAEVFVTASSSNTTYTNSGTSGAYIWGAQLELGSTASPYQRVTIAENVTEASVPTCHYLRYDGFNSSMSTAAIDFTGTDKMSAFAGVRKLSDAAQGVVVELSATIVSNNGSFLLAAPDGATATFGFDSKGTAQVDAVASSLTAPISRIVTGLADIAGDRATIRIDGVQADQDTGDQGTGNFGNYAMFIGRRNNATLPFNGRDYGIIVVGKSASAGEITDTETWLAAKTAQVTL